VSGRLAVQSALEKHSKRVVDRHRAVRRGMVTSLHPLTVDVSGFDHPLTQTDDFEMSQWMVAYNQGTKLRVGDTVLLHQEEHEWVLVDVISDATVGSLGAGGPAAAAAGVTQAGVVAARAWRSAAWQPASGFQAIPVDTVEYDSGSNINLAQNAFIVTVAGYYQVSVGACVQNSASAFNAQVGVVVNGSVTHALEGAPNVGGQAMYPVMSATDIVRCVAGDRIQAYFWASTTPPAMAQAQSNFLAVALITVGAGPQGPPGPVGPPGSLPPGSGDQNYVFTQVSGAVTWTVAHNLAKYPSVTIVDSANNELVADVHHVDQNNVTISFANATAGKAYIN
jgi:hypothetical protein